MEHENVQGRDPAIEFADPIVKSRLWDNNQVGAVDVLKMLQVTKEGNRLQRFAKTHLVGENSIDSVLEKRNKPVQALELIISHCSSFDIYI
jgi:hypothetical protein